MNIKIRFAKQITPYRAYCIMVYICDTIFKTKIAFYGSEVWNLKTTIIILKNNRRFNWRFILIH